MSTDKDKIKQRIEKLINLANDPSAFKGEVDNAIRFARRLMLQHNIDESELRKPGQSIDEQAKSTTYGESFCYSFGRDLSKWEGYLCYAICKLVQTCHYYQVSRMKFDRVGSDGKIETDNRGLPRKVTRVVFYGPVSDVRTCVELFNEWVTIIVSMSRMRFGSWIRNEARSFNEGFVVGMIHSVDEAKKEEQTNEESSKALVVVQANALMTAKANQAKVWLSQKGVKTVTKKAHRNRGDDLESFNNGVREGKQAGFGLEQKLKLT